MINNFIFTVIGFTLLIAVCLSTWLYTSYGFEFTAAFLAGAAWGSVNLFLIKCLVEILLSNHSKNYIKISWLLVVKFPLLYGAGYLLLKGDEQHVIAFVCGLTLLFVLTVLLGIRFSLQKGLG